MIHCSLCKQPNELWEVTQFFPHLQKTVNKFQVYFECTDQDIRNIVSNDTTASTGVSS